MFQRGENVKQETAREADDPIRQDPTSHHNSANAEEASDESEIVITHGYIPSPSQKTLLEFGQDLVKDSVTLSIEFHKTMLGLTATFATLMASAFAILVAGSEEQHLGSSQRAFLVAPVFLMLASSVCFALGYYPRRVTLRLQVLDTIEEARDTLLRRRQFLALSGISLFVLAICCLLVGILLLNVV